MASIAGPRIIEDGLILHLDAANPRSYRGPTAFNVINSATNSFPTAGNAWATYQTNNYNNNQYFSIGGVHNVTNDIVTMTGPHPLRTYDAVRPQTSGGGVTAGIDYFVKKISATAFSLHSYNSTQNGTLGFSVLDPIFNDQRQSLTATNFPTMWWGAPHLPNSDTIKTIVPNGFNLNGRIHDCVRINWFRPDGIGLFTGGAMAYGVMPVLDAGTTYTWSFYHKAGNERSLGQTGYFLIYFSSNQTATATNFIPRTQWNRHSYTFTTPGITSSSVLMYWFPNGDISITSGLAYDIAEIQIEKRSDSTPFLPTTRGSTAGSGGGFNDLTPSNNQLEVVNGSGYTAQNGGGIVLDGIDDYIITTEAKGLPLGNSSRTISIWTKFSTLKNSFVQLGSAPDQRYIFQCADFSGTVYLFTDGVNGENNLVISGFEIPALNVWNNLVFSNNGQNWKYYINGSLVKSGTFTTTLNTGGNKILVGERDDYPYDNMNGTISMVSIYNRALSDGEVKQNFNATRKRFGI
jgi:hypothetical protein